MSAEAEVTNPVVKVTLSGNDPERPLRGVDRTEWVWSISSADKGKQLINIAVRYSFSAGPDEHRTYPVTVEFVRPFMTVEQLNVTAVVATFLGSVVSAPFLYALMKDLRAARRSSEQTRPPGPS